MKSLIKYDIKFSYLFMERDGFAKIITLHKMSDIYQNRFGTQNPLRMICLVSLALEIISSNLNKKINLRAVWLAGRA